MLNCLFTKVASILPSSDCDDHYYLPSCDDIIIGGPWLASPALELTALDRTSQVATLTTDHSIFWGSFLHCAFLDH